jgi:hypothetical protein
MEATWHFASVTSRTHWRTVDPYNQCVYQGIGPPVDRSGISLIFGGQAILDVCSLAEDKQREISQCNGQDTHIRAGGGCRGRQGSHHLAPKCCRTHTNTPPTQSLLRSRPGCCLASIDAQHDRRTTRRAPAAATDGTRSLPSIHSGRARGDDHDEFAFSSFGLSITSTPSSRRQSTKPAASAPLSVIARRRNRRSSTTGRLTLGLGR